jgi:hypothetical protein
VSLQNTAAVFIRVGILTLPIVGLLVLVGGLFSFGVPSPESYPTEAAQAGGTTGFFLAQIGSQVLGPTLAIFGILALFAYLVNTSVRRLATVVATLAMVLSILGMSMLLSTSGIHAYAVPALAQEYLNGQQNALQLVDTIFRQAIVVEILANLLIFVGFVLFGVGIWRSGTLPKWAGVLLAVSSLVFAVPAYIPPLVILVSLLLVIAGVEISRGILRQPPPAQMEAEAQPRVR